MQAKKTSVLQPGWIAAILITAAACYIHIFYWLHVGGLWRDEVNLLGISGRHSFTEMGKDSFPILMPLILRLWTAVGLGDSDLHLRFIGLLVGLGTLAALWIAAWKIRRTPPLLGLVLLGLNDTVVFFGDSLRAYGLGSLCAVALTASAFLFVQKPSGRRAAWLMLFAVLSVQVLYHNVVLVATISFGTWAVCWRRKDGRAALQVLLVAVVAAASLLPYLPNLLTNVDTSMVIRTGATLRRFFWAYDDTLSYPLNGFIYNWLNNWRAGESVVVFIYKYPFLRTVLNVWSPLAVIIIVRAGVGLWKNFKTPAKTGEFVERDLSLFAAVTLILATVGFPLFFWRAQMPVQSWYVLPFLASVVVCFDAALPAFTGLLRAAYLGLVTGTALISFLSTRTILDRQFSDVNLYTPVLMAHAAPDDFIIVYPWTCGITFHHYYQGGTPWNTLPPLSDHSVHRFDLIKLQIQNTNALAPIFQQITHTLQSGHRVWVLTMEHGVDIPPPGTSPLQPLPPPPLKYTGWSESPYSYVWATQVALFLADHSAQYVEVRNPSSQIYLTESMELLGARGWRTNSPAH